MSAISAAKEETAAGHLARLLILLFSRCGVLLAVCVGLIGIVAGCARPTSDTGAHRMKEALSIVKIDFVNKDGVTQDFLKVSGNAAQQSAANFRVDTETEAKKFYIRVQVDPAMSITTLDMTLKAGDVDVVSHLVSTATPGVLKSNKPVVLLPPRAEAGVEGGELVGIKVKAQPVPDVVRANKGIKGFRLDASAALPTGGAVISGRIPVQVITEIGWIDDLVMPEDEAAFKISAAPGFDMIPLVVRVGDVEKPFTATVGNGDTVGVENDSQEWYDAVFTAQAFGHAGDAVTVTMADDLPAANTRPSDVFTISDHAAYLVDPSGAPLGRVFGSDQGGRRAGGIGFAGVTTPGFQALQYAGPLSATVPDVITATWADGSAVTLTETAPASLVFVSADSRRVIAGGIGATSATDADSLTVTWASRSIGGWSAGAARCSEDGPATLRFVPLGRSAATRVNLSSVGMPMAFTVDYAETVQVSEAGAAAQGWIETAVNSGLFAAPDGAGVLALGAITGNEVVAVILNQGAAGLTTLAPVAPGSATFVPVLLRAPGEQISEAPYRHGFRVVKRGNFPGAGVTVRTPLQTRTFADDTLIKPTYGPALAADEIQIQPGGPVWVVASNDPVAEGSKPAGGSDIVYDGSGNEIKIGATYVGIVLGNGDGEFYRIFEFPDGPEVTDDQGETGKERVLYAYTNGAGVFTTSGIEVFADQTHAVKAGEYFRTEPGSPNLYAFHSDSRFADRDLRLERAYDRAESKCAEIAQALQGNAKVKAVMDATIMMFGPSDEDIAPVVAAWERGENVGQVIVCGGKVLTKQMVMDAVGGFAVKWGGKVVVAGAAKTIGATKGGAIVASAVVAVYAAMHHATGKWGGKIVNGTASFLTGHFNKHRNEWSKFGDLPGVDVSDAAKYASRAKDILNAVDKSSGNFRVFKEVQSSNGNIIKIVYRKDTNEITMLDTTVDEITTIFRPGADKATDAADMAVKATDYLTRKIPANGWQEVF